MIYRELLEVLSALTDADLAHHVKVDFAGHRLGVHRIDDGDGRLVFDTRMVWISDLSLSEGTDDDSQ